MKINFKYISIILVLFAMFSCEKEYEAPGPEAVKSYIAINKTTVQVNGFIDLGDLSSGLKLRKWTFPADVTNVKGSDNNSTSEAPIVSVSFNTAGWYKVLLHQEYIDTLKDDGDNTGLSVIDTTFLITVLDSVKTSYTANYLARDGSDSAFMTLGNDVKNELWAGEYVKFISTATGGANRYIWSVEGPGNFYSEGVDSIKTIQFKQLGEYAFTHIAYRENPDGYDTVTHTSLIKVIPSPLPVSLNSATKTDKRTIVLDYSRSMSDPAAEASNFSLKVVNNANFPVNVTSAVLDKDEDNKVVLTLDADVYDNDTITFSYTPGNLKTLDGIAADAVTDLAVDLTLVSILPTEYDAGFEKLPATEWPSLNWGGQWDKYDFSISTTVAHTGAQSGKVILDPAGGMAMSSKVKFPTEDGVSYMFGFWMYVEEPGDGSDNAIALFPPSFAVQFPGYTTNSIYQNKWAFVSGIHAPGAIAEFNLIIRGQSINSTTQVVAYIDDIILAPIELRP